MKLTFLGNIRYAVQLFSNLKTLNSMLSNTNQNISLLNGNVNLNVEFEGLDIPCDNVTVTITECGNKVEIMLSGVTFDGSENEILNLFLRKKNIVLESVNEMKKIFSVKLDTVFEPLMLDKISKVGIDGI